MAHQVNGRSLLHSQVQPPVKEESKQQVTLLAIAKLPETPAPTSLKEDQSMASFRSSLSFSGKPIKDIEDDDIWSPDDPWLKEMQKLQPLLQKFVPGRVATCTPAKDWSLQGN